MVMLNYLLLLQNGAARNFLETPGEEKGVVSDLTLVDDEVMQLVHHGTIWKNRTL